ncbi:MULTISPECIES: hypothetical protein [unclassified Rhodococcus (in: high G+C Gram-positive bacteria)]|uniref:hypothetical protein n=1 Tax=unclassified Rhodococcus (in: high G+C Gram-positive bacteria) TaxID=192944 RepID=UPI003393A6D5
MARDPRAAIIDAARIEFGKRRYFMTRIDDIADFAAVPRAAVKKLLYRHPRNRRKAHCALSSAATPARGGGSLRA